MTLRRRTLVGALLLSGVTFAWAGATTWYILARDEIAQVVFARQTELRYAYEDRIAELKGRLEREITKNLVERNGFQAQADALAARQREIESRQAWLSGLADRLAGAGGMPAGPVAGGDLLPKTAGSPAIPAAAPPAKPSPLDDPPNLRLRSSLEGRPGPDRPRDRLSLIEQSLSRTAAGALGLADGIRKLANERAIRVRVALEATRIDLAALPGAGRTGATPASGGPLVPLPSGFDAGSISPLLTEAEARVTELDGLLSAARSLPLGPPLTDATEPTSSFGYRVDPFTRGPALHTGIDFRAESGSPVLATAKGRVIAAEYVGGYGNMVEIDHGGGVATRYGHLSAFTVAAGATVEAGQMIGRVGSTGRSTGAHLHYETRIGGEPVNPIRFLEASRLLAEAGPTAAR